MVRYLVGVILLLALLHSVTSQCSTGSLQLGPITSSNGTVNVGLLLVCRDGVWGTILVDNTNSFWSEKNSLVACRSLGFSAALNSIPAIQIHPNVRPGSDVPVLYRSVACTGVEDLITDCPGVTAVNGTFTHFSDVYVVCLPGSEQYNDLHTVIGTTPQFGIIRLVGDATNGRGAVEIFTNVGWSTICPDSSWSDSDANIICQSLGYDRGTPHKYTLPSSASSTVSSQMVKDSQCSSKRVPSLFRIDGGYCSFVLAEASNPCTVSGYAGVVCSTRSEDQSVRLFGLDGISTSRFVGVVEYQLGGRWGVLCAPTVQNSFTSQLLCRDLGIHRDESSFYKTLSTVQLQTLESRQKPAWLLDFSCDTTNRRLKDCNVVRPIGYGKCARSGDILVLDCGPRRRSLSGGEIAAIVVPIVLVAAIILFLVIRQDLWKPKLKNSKCWKGTQACLQFQCLRHCKASVARKMAKYREKRQRRQADQRRRQEERQQRRDEERAAREAARETTAREAAREAVIDEATNIPPMALDATTKSSELFSSAPPPYSNSSEFLGIAADVPPPYQQQ